MSRKVIIVAPEVLHTFLQDNYRNWEVQPLTEDIPALWDGLESGRLSDESDVVILFDGLYQSDKEGFIDAIASFAPEALVMVLSYEPGWQDYITNEFLGHEATIEHKKQYGKEPSFEFIQSEIAIKAIDEAVDYYDNGKAAMDDFRKQNPVQINPNADATPVQKAQTNRDGLVVTVTSSKGGSGKSTVALLLAAQLAQSSKKAFEEGTADRPLDIAIIDLDTFDGQLGFVLNQSKPTALNIRLSESILDADLVKNNLVYSERMGVHALLAPIRGATARYVDPPFYAKVINIMKTMFDVVIIDTSVQHYDDLIKTVALPLADAILLVTTLDIKSVKGLARWMKVAADPLDKGGHDIDTSKVGIVVNGSLQGVGMGNQELTTAALGAKLLVAIPLDTKAVQAAGNINRLEDILEHPEIGPAYFKLAKRFAKASKGWHGELSAIIDEAGNAVKAPAKSQQPVQASNTGGAKPAGKATKFPWGRKK